MTGRMQEATLMRFVDYGVRVLTLTDQMYRDERPRRVIDQLVGSGTSAGANLFEASEAISKADFLKGTLNNLVDTPHKSRGRLICGLGRKLFRGPSRPLALSRRN